MKRTCAGKAGDNIIMHCHACIAEQTVSRAKPSRTKTKKLTIILLTMDGSVHSSCPLPFLRTVFHASGFVSANTKSNHRQAESIASK